MREESKISEIEYYTVNDRPVKMMPTEDGGRTVLVLNWQTGEFEADMSYLSRCYNPEQDVDRLSEAKFDQYVSELKREIDRR
ncbi:MAG: hypothetical protein AAFQ14_01665 [Cyanobacteria bacterium J06621_12]